MHLLDGTDMNFKTHTLKNYRTKVSYMGEKKTWLQKGLLP